MSTYSLSHSNYRIHTRLLDPFVCHWKLQWNSLNRSAAHTLDSWGSLWMWKLTVSPCPFSGPIRAKKHGVYFTVWKGDYCLSTCQYYLIAQTKTLALLSSNLVWLHFGECKQIKRSSVTSYTKATGSLLLSETLSTWLPESGWRQTKQTTWGYYLR